MAFTDIADLGGPGNVPTAKGVRRALRSAVDFYFLFKMTLRIPPPGPCALWARAYTSWGDVSHMVSPA